MRRRLLLAGGLGLVAAGGALLALFVRAAELQRRLEESGALA